MSEGEKFYEIGSAEKISDGQVEYSLVLYNAVDAVKIDDINEKLELRKKQIEEIEKAYSVEGGEVFGKTDEGDVLSLEIAQLKRQKIEIGKRSLSRMEIIENVIVGGEPTFEKGDMLAKNVVDGFLKMKDEDGKDVFALAGKSGRKVMQI